MSKSTRKTRKWERNVRRRAELIALGFSEVEAQAIIEESGRVVEQLFIERDRVEAQRLRALRDRLRADDDRRYPRQPSSPQSVRAVPTAFERSRRRH